MDEDYHELKNLNLLYVEDDISAQEVISGILENYFFNVFVANNGEEAFKIYEDKNIDLIITDLEMPEIDGLSFITKIRELDYHVPIVVFTAYTDTSHLLPCANQNIQGYIEKPLSEEKITNVFKNLLTYISNDIKDPSHITKLKENLLYDSEKSKLIKDDKIIKLSKKEKLLLDLLIENKSHLVSYDQIELNIWQKQDDVMTGTALRTLIKSVRQKTDKSIIQNISGIGYVLEI